MIDGTDVDALAAELEARDATLFHACQLRDFTSYLTTGGIPSRQLLERRGLFMTPFDTDEVDRINGVWDKVFLNFTDFGELFARGAAVTPNAYGPIVIVTRPSALRQTADIAVCLRSAGAAGFDREAEALRIQAIPHLFRSPRGAPNQHQVKSSTDLQATFGSTAEYPEISCTIDPQLIPVDEWIAILVDPYVVSGCELVDVVRAQACDAALSVPVRVRRSATRQATYSRLATAISEGISELPQLLMTALDAPTIEWASAVVNADLSYQFSRYARYLMNGTLRDLTG